MLLWSCANMLAPAGGPKDIKPPKVSKSEPSNNQTEYTKAYIKLTFDEYIGIDNLNNELIVSPPLKYKPTSKISGKTAIISWTDTLLDNTTYTFNFGKSIIDINEGNILENFTLTFSTGKEIDSAEYKGVITTVDKNETLKSAFVYLSEQPFTDSTFFPVRAQYQTKTNAQGFFKFQGVKPSTYQLFFLEDKNSNKIADNGEYVGFSDTPILIKYSEIVEEPDTAKTTEVTIIPNYKSFPFYNSKNHFIKNVFVLNDKQIAFLPQENIFLEKCFAIDQTHSFPSFLFNDTFFVVNTKSNIVQLKITNNNQTNLYNSDTLKMLSKPGMLKLYRKKQLDNKPNDTFYTLKATLPIQHFDTSKVVLKWDSIETKPTVFWDEFSVSIVHHWEEGKQYKITIQDSAYKFNDSIWNKKELVFQHNIPFQKELSNFELRFIRTGIEFRDINLIVQIEKDQEKYFYFLAPGDSILTLSSLKAGSYTVSVYGDKNGNGIWDSGNIQQYIQAEPIFRLNAPIEIKKGWDGDMKIEL